MPPQRTDRLWTRLVWPLLWPLLLAQLALVGLCLAAGLFLGLGQPGPASWAAVGWLLLALLLGTALTTAAFLLQLRHRLGACQVSVEQHLDQLERQARELEACLPPWLHEPGRLPADDTSLLARFDRLQEALEAVQAGWQQRPWLTQLLTSTTRPGLLLFQGRIVAGNRAMEQLLGESLAGVLGQDPMPRLHSLGSGEGEPERMQVLDADGAWRHRQVERFTSPGYELLLFAPHVARPDELDELLTARERAREESRLKSRYLALLHRELAPLLEDLEQELESVLGRVEAQRLAELRERAADVRLLLDSLVDEARELAPGGREPLPGRGLRVLVVDDGPVNRMLATQVLEGQGLAVDSVASGYHALERRARHRYDLVFMDIYMPDMDGVETARRWREAEAGEGAGAHSVLVALTANASESDRLRFREAGMDDFLAKPYRPNDLIAMLRHWRPDAFKELLTT